MRCVTFNTNIESRATGQYKKFNFNSMKKFGDTFIGTSPTGFYVFGGDLDAGTNIDAWIKTGTTDLGIDTNKRLRRITLEVETDGDLEIEIIANKKVVRIYAVKARGAGLQRIKVPAGRDHKGVFWSFLIRNKKGVKFSVYSISILPVVLHHGHL